jgi:hypothetical protein
VHPGVNPGRPSEDTLELRALVERFLQALPLFVLEEDR